MRAGDHYLTNDPWLGTGHLHDFTLVSPTFLGERPVALFASTVHVVDIGGRGFGPDGRQVYEEGLCVPIMPLARAGPGEPGPAGDRAGERARAGAGRGRSVLPDGLQRQGLRAAARDDGRVRHRQHRAAGRPHLRALARCNPGGDRQSCRPAPITTRSSSTATIIRSSSKAALTISAERDSRRLHRHLAGEQLRHQRADALHHRLHLVRREVPGGAGGSQQRRLARADHGQRPGGVDPERAAALRGRDSARDRAHAARRRLRLPAPGARRGRAGRGRFRAVDPAAARRATA